MTQMPFRGSGMVLATAILLLVVLFLVWQGMSFMLSRRGRNLDQAKRDADRRPPDDREVT